MPRRERAWNRRSSRDRWVKQNSTNLQLFRMRAYHYSGMASHPRDRDLEADLSEQLQFLVSSGRAFDQGALSESKRIALVIRVLVHDTGPSHSLLSQLGVKDSLAWADSAPVIDNDPSIIGRSPGLTSMGFGADGIAFSARYLDSIETSNRTRYVSFSDWWERHVILDSNGAEFSRKELVLALVNKDGGAHVDRLNEKTHALVHGNSAGFVCIDTAGGPSEPIPTPVYASVRTVAEELLLTLRRSGRTVPSSLPLNPLVGVIDSFTAADYTGKALVLDKSRDDVSHVSFKFETLPDVTFEVARIQLPQSEPGFDGSIPAGWLDFVGVRDASGDIVHQSGTAGPTEASSPPSAAATISTPTAAGSPVTFAFDNFPQAEFAAVRWQQKRETMSPWGREVREAGWIDLYVTLNGATGEMGGFLGPAA
jgi:hypothetical protein